MFEGILLFAFLYYVGSVRCYSRVVEGRLMKDAVNVFINDPDMNGVYISRLFFLRYSKGKGLLNVLILCMNSPKIYI